ncbi:hypothetical protein ANCCEY_00400 [Ancylostoma ceylanicum]|uniref:Sulfotransferase domain-containing protein n=1 Tax=Ancylostoma ceylanicum TaxID=53326 RepID=A0A0D6MA91_9BILA|nr:hypothetical protein ANCCEY_00400 [Ancylostoma ceylanicum]
MTSIMCYLYDVLAYQKNVLDLTRDTYSKRGKNEYDSIRVLDSFRNTTSGPEQPWLNIIVVRDPLDRFLSAFINKCIRHCELRENFRKYKIVKYTGSNTKEMLNELEVEFKNRGVGQGVLDDIRDKFLHQIALFSFKY